ncbi:MAG TPA: hypothetical protein VJ464_05270 [Blastocatellia bacterium]|nr:hypothetical protein [Blastocatellia bacterium]
MKRALTRKAVTLAAMAVVDGLAAAPRCGMAQQQGDSLTNPTPATGTTDASQSNVASVTGWY